MNTALNSWWNLVFVLPFALGVLLTALSLPALGRRGAPVRVGGRTAGGRMAATRSATHSATPRAAGRSSRSTANAGRQGRSESLPPLLWAQCVLLWWGACGYGCNLLLGLQRPHASAFVVATLGALSLSLASASLLAKLAPPPSREVGGRDALEGLGGEAAATISEAGGSAYVRDEHGVLHSVACFCEGGESIRCGQSLLTICWDEARESYRVRRWSPEP